ncbi:MAG: hypothetical protein IPF42_02735 [Candidatus Microthrix sp.]|nr:hypothetical protein [Candidatus Microthrix sp.]
MRFVVTDTATGTSATVDPDDVFEPWQVGQLASRVDLLVTAAQIVAQDPAVDGHRVEVRADAWISTGRPPEDSAPSTQPRPDHRRSTAKVMRGG